MKCEQHGLDLLNFEPIGYLFCEECLAGLDQDEENNERLHTN